jgi:hypothetical protein
LLVTATAAVPEEAALISLDGRVVPDRVSPADQVTFLEVVLFISSREGATSSRNSWGRLVVININWLQQLHTSSSSNNNNEEAVVWPPACLLTLTPFLLSLNHSRRSRTPLFHSRTRENLPPSRQALVTIFTLGPTTARS